MEDEEYEDEHYHNEIDKVQDLIGLGVPLLLLLSRFLLRHCWLLLFWLFIRLLLKSTLVFYLRLLLVSSLRVQLSVLLVHEEHCLLSIDNWHARILH